MTSPLPRAPLFTRADFDLRGRGAIDDDLRDRLERWAAHVNERLRDLGLATEGAVVDGKAGPPGVVFVRDAREREAAMRVARAQRLDYRPLFAGVFAENAKLVLRLTHATVEARFELPASALVDTHNLRGKIAHPEGLLAATSVVESLPEQFWGGVENGPQGSVARVTGSELREWLDASVRAGTCLFFGWTLPRDIALSQKSELASQLVDAFSALGALYDALAWSDENDFFSPKRRAAPVSERESARSKSTLGHPKKPKRSRKADELEEAADARAAKRANVQKNGSNGAVMLAPRGVPGALHPRGTGDEAKLTLAEDGRAMPAFPRKRPILRRAPPGAMVDPRAPIEKGTRICVLDGPFSGKIGTVSELDGKGGARVLFGLLAARLRVVDIVACADKKERHKLSSSHRRPLGDRG